MHLSPIYTRMHGEWLRLQNPQVDDIAGNEGQRRQLQGTKTQSVTERRKKPWEKPGSVGGPFLLWPDGTAVQFQLLQSQIVRAQLVPEVLS